MSLAIIIILILCFAVIVLFSVGILAAYLWENKCVEVKRLKHFIKDKKLMQEYEDYLSNCKTMKEYYEVF